MLTLQARLSHAGLSLCQFIVGTDIRKAPLEVGNPPLRGPDVEFPLPFRTFGSDTNEDEQESMGVTKFA